jgi:hypothetical protein
MRNARTAVLLLAALLANSASASEYRFEEIGRKVILMSGAQEVRVAVGQRAKGGDKVETGWFSRALIASDEHRARFEIFSATEVTLAEGTPGVILSLERGRIRAAFDKITGSEPRVVKTPGALLAVRGTEFSVRVDSGGNTTLDVYEGIVEVQSPLRPDPLFVHPGQESTFGRERPPHVGTMPEHRRREGEREGGTDRARPDPRRRPDDGNVRPPGEGGGQHGGHQPPPPQQQPPPPRKPPV